MTDQTTTQGDDDFGAFLANLSSDLDAPASSPSQYVVARKETPVEERHTCFECNGTGQYRGVRIHQEKQHCFACKGKGWFKRSYADRQKAKAKTAERKQRKATEAQEAFREANPGLIEGLEAISGWHQFASDLLVKFWNWNSLTERQIAAARNALARVEAKRAERNAEKSKKGGEVGVERIEELFRTAQANGLKRPRFITARLVISPAPATGRNAGALYVKCDGEYAGKIVNGQLQALREAPADILQLVRDLAADPLEAAKRYGRSTGTCSCCGRELTDKQSIEAGIGPVCAEKWF